MNQVMIGFATTILLSFCLWQTETGPLNKPAPLHIKSGNSAISVIVKRRIIHFTNTEPSSPLELRIDDLRSLLNTYFLDHARESHYSFTFGQYTELNARMASAASCSRQWNSQAGRARNGNSASWLRKQLNKEQAYRELIPVFDEIGYRIDIAAMESIILCRAAEIDWTSAPRSCSVPIPPRAKLPCGAMLTFSLTRK
jgi:hypothetical protein